MSATYRKERLDRGIKARSEDIFALASYRELLYLIMPRALLIGGLLIFPLLSGVIGQAWLNVMVIACTTALLALSWELLASVGLVSLGQALFFGVGGYIAGYLNAAFSLPPLLTIPIGTLLGALLCTAMLYPAIRLRGIYFALITLTLPLLFQRVIEATKILGGTEGLSALDPLPETWMVVYIAVAAVLTSLFGFRRLLDSDYGLVLKAIRDNDRAVLAAGIDVQRYKAQAVFIAALPATFAGALSTHQLQFVGIPVFTANYSILPLASAMVGGVGSFAGSLIGALILVPISELFRGFGTWRVVVYSAILVVFIVALPAGIFPSMQRMYHQFERRVPLEGSR